MSEQKDWHLHFTERQRTVIAQCRAQISVGRATSPMILIISKFADLMDEGHALTQALRHALQQEDAE